ncbi:MAG: hypothetical protein JXQ76_13220 [Campylobacterales bacterium]|nr:hypothetical protein [Campylobacterales bacterium]
MLHRSLNTLSDNFSLIVDETLRTSDRVSLQTPKGVVVMMSQEDYCEMEATLALLKDPKSLKALLEGHQQRQNNQEPQSYSIEEVFGDLQN